MTSLHKARIKETPGLFLITSIIMSMSAFNSKKNATKHTQTNEQAPVKLIHGDLNFHEMKEKFYRLYHLDHKNP